MGFLVLYLTPTLHLRAQRASCFPKWELADMVGYDRAKRIAVIAPCQCRCHGPKRQSTHSFAALTSCKLAMACAPALARDESFVKRV